MKLNDFGFIRVAACVPDVKLACPTENSSRILDAAGNACSKGARIICFPELSLTGCTVGDLANSRSLLDKTEDALSDILTRSASLDAFIVIGMPLESDGRLFSAFVAICKGEIAGITAARFPAGAGNFASSDALTSGTVTICGRQTAVSRSIVFRCGEASVVIESGYDLLSPTPASSALALAGANVILCPAAFNELPGRARQLESVLSQRSLDCNSVIVLASSGEGESSTDCLFSGHAVIAENGAILAASHKSDTLALTDIDTELLENARRKNRAFRNPRTRTFHFDEVHASIPGKSNGTLLRTVSPAPFHQCPTVFADTFRIQTEALIARLRHIGTGKVILGVSGGLDSTLALLVCVNAFDSMGSDRSNIIGVTMPGFGTTGRTYTNAVEMMKALGIDWREISIKDACLQHLKDIGHDLSVHDSAYENAQARERTQILMDLGNKLGAMVVGTGDLSELALGWCTYNGDHMSMYGVNAGVPKTLIAGIIREAAGTERFAAAKTNLLDVTETPITPELLPSDDKDSITQKTEDIIGPYELHDFFLYNFAVNGFNAEKIRMLAGKAFADKYVDAEIVKWLKIFIKRFFSNQFKRSCMPDGPCTGPVSLSPRGGWQMPSDVSSEEWLRELG